MSGISPLLPFAQVTAGTPLDPFTVTISEAANDRLEVNTLAGTDTVGSGALAAGAIQLFVNGVLRP